MSNQRRTAKSRGALLGLTFTAIVISGCASDPAAVTGGPTTMTKPSGENFSITYIANVPGDLAVSVSPYDGDANLESKQSPTEPENKIVWTSERKFGIKFVKIDNPRRSPNRKFGPNQSDGWNLPQNDAACGEGKERCVYTLELEPGKGNGRKEIRAAKYIIASPAGCNEQSTVPADCKWQDPVIIVRY